MQRVITTKREYLGRNFCREVDSLLRNNAATCLVVDEAHLIDSEDRGGHP